MMNDSIKRADPSNSRLEYTLNVPYELKVHDIVIDKIRFLGDFNIRLVNDLLALKDPNLDVNFSDDLSRFNGFYQATNGERIYFDYSYPRAQATKSRNTWIEFNPAKFPVDEMGVLTDVLFSYMNNVHCTRLDLAFDVEEDLSSYQVYQSTAVVRREFFNRNNQLETRYLGSPNSDSYIKIYDKKAEQLTKHIQIEQPVLWRFEITLKTEKIYYLINALDNIDLYLPNYENLDTVQEKAMMFYLQSDLNNWSKIDKRTKTKYRKYIREHSDFKVTEILRKNLKKQEKRLITEVNDFLILFNTQKKLVAADTTTNL